MTLLVVALAPSAVRGQTPPVHQPDPDIANGSERQRLEAAKAEWGSAAVVSYRYEIKVTCFCSPPPRYRTMVVRGSRPTRQSKREPSTLATVPRLFRVIRQGIDEGAARLDVTYGPRGVPRQIFIDRHAFVADEEVGYTIRNFRATRTSSTR